MSSFSQWTAIIATLSSLLLIVHAGLDADDCGCQPGQNCDFKKWSGTGTECECECWDVKGNCKPDGWKRVAGKGTCDFEASPAGPLEPCQCPPGLSCDFQKSTGSGTECECECWDEAGKCTADGWKRTKGTESCDFEATAPGSAPPGPCACPAGISCDFLKYSGTGTECECECWDEAGKCARGGWKRIKGNGSCDFNADPAPLQPCQCPPGLNCEFKKSTSTGTECKCECWDEAGKCTADGWKRSKGKESCNFEATIEPAPTPTPAPKDSCGCPDGKTCEYFKVSPLGTECECECWNSAGKCTATGWKKTKGPGSCAFGAGSGP